MPRTNTPNKLSRTSAYYRANYRTIIAIFKNSSTHLSTMTATSRKTCQHDCWIQPKPKPLLPRKLLNHQLQMPSKTDRLYLIHVIHGHERRRKNIFIIKLKEQWPCSNFPQFSFKHNVRKRTLLFIFAQTHIYRWSLMFRAFSLSKLRRRREARKIENESNARNLSAGRAFRIVEYFEYRDICFENFDSTNLILHEWSRRSIRRWF